LFRPVRAWPQSGTTLSSTPYLEYLKLGERFFTKAMRSRIAYVRAIDAVRGSRNRYFAGAGALRRASTAPSVAFAFDIVRLSLLRLLSCCTE
jgi:hypothetical protein